MALMNNTYNLTKLGDSNTVIEVVKYANDATGEILVGLFVIAVFFIMMFMLTRFDFTDRLLSASFVCFLLSMVFMYAELINFMFVILFLAILAFTTLYVYVSRD